MKVINVVPNTIVLFMLILLCVNQQSIAQNSIAPFTGIKYFQEGDGRQTFQTGLAAGRFLVGPGSRNT